MNDYLIVGFRCDSIVAQLKLCHGSHVLHHGRWNRRTYDVNLVGVFRHSQTVDIGNDGTCSKLNADVVGSGFFDCDRVVGQCVVGQIVDGLKLCS